MPAIDLTNPSKVAETRCVLLPSPSLLRELHEMRLLERYAATRTGIWSDTIASI
jgi:hypothetical protein